MDIQDKIQLGEHRYVDAVNVDTTIKLPLQGNNGLNIEYDIQNILDVTQIFDNERQESLKYRIHGEFEYLSILNGLPKDYTKLSDFFSLTSLSADTKNLYTDLKIYLVKPSIDFTELIADEKYIKNYEIVADVTNIEFFNSGFAKNIYSEQQYTYVSNKDADISNQYDGLNFPLTELALYVVYQPQKNGNNISELMESKTYDSVGETTVQNFTPTNLGIIKKSDISFTAPNTINIDLSLSSLFEINNKIHIYGSDFNDGIYNIIGRTNDKIVVDNTIISDDNIEKLEITIADIVEGDVIDYDKLLYQQIDYNLMEHYIYTTYLDNVVPKIMKWKYRPFIPIKIKYFDVNIIRGNTGSTSYEIVSKIPSYATKIDNDGNYVWRNTLDNGFYDPIEEIGVSFPFINQRHYVFSNIVFKVQPDLEHTNTSNVFDQILFDQNQLINSEPNSSLDNIGEICN